jgi:hypothetical protein
MARFHHFLTVHFLDEDLLQALAVSLYFFIVKWDLAEFLPVILSAFTRISNEMRTEACISPIADIIEHSPELLEPRQIGPVIELASASLDYLSPTPLEDLLALIRAMTGAADADGRAALLSLALGIVRVGADRLPPLEPACGLLAVEALRDAAAFLAQVRANPWVPEFVGGCLIDSDARDVAERIVRPVGWENLFGLVS